MAKKKARDDGGWGNLIRDVVVILLLVLGIHSCVAKPFYIPSDSMMPILRNGDRLIVSKYPYGWSYSSVSFHLASKVEGRIFGTLHERGDIVVLEHPLTSKIGRAHVCTPVTNAHLVCRPLSENKNQKRSSSIYI